VQLFLDFAKTDYRLRVRSRQRQFAVHQEHRHYLEPLPHLQIEQVENIVVDQSLAHDDIGDAELFAERGQEYVFANPSLADDNLAEALAALLLQRDRLFHLLRRDQPLADQQIAHADRFGRLRRRLFDLALVDVETVDDIDHLVEPGNAEDIAYQRLGVGDLEPAAVLDQALAQIEQGFEPLAVDQRDADHVDDKLEFLLGDGLVDRFFQGFVRFRLG
jgi:hypothetical protein